MPDPSLRLLQATSQLPVSSYFDANLYQREQQRLFANGPRYLGHELAVPELGDYYALPHEGEGRALVRNSSGIELISNVCRHRQSTMLQGRGNTGSNIVCPLHRWTYNTSGELIGAPHFEVDPCLNLNRYQTTTWNGLVFETNGRDIAAEMAPLGFEGMALGGLGVGEPPAVMHAVVDAIAPEMPRDRPRYLMGVGRPEDLLAMIEEELRQRRFAEIVRIELGHCTDPWLREFLMTQLELKDEGML